MTTAPAVLCDRVERAGITGVLVAREDPAPSLMRLEFQLEKVPDAALEPGAHVGFRVAPTQFRRFSIARMDAATARATVIVERRTSPSGPAATVLDGWSPGERVAWCGVQLSRSVRWPSAGELLLLGDASAVGFAMSFAARAGQEGRMLRGAILAPPDAREAVRMLLPAFATPIEPTSWIASETQAVDLSSTTAFIVGGAAFIQQTRATLRAHGFGRRQIRSHAFWATGRVGLG